MTDSSNPDDPGGIAIIERVAVPGAIGAIAYDTPSQSTQQESVRKRRTIAGAAQLVINQPRWLLPWKNPIWIEFVSHKIARLFSPGLLLIAAATNIALAGQPLYCLMLTLQFCFYTRRGAT